MPPIEAGLTYIDSVHSLLATAPVNAEPLRTRAVPPLVLTP